jgi:hypothetical protein
MNYRIRKNLGVCLLIIFSFFAHGYWVSYSTSVKTTIESVEEIKKADHEVVFNEFEKGSSHKRIVMDDNAKKSGTIHKAISFIVNSLRKTDEVTLFEKNIEPLKKFLIGVDIVGFVSDIKYLTYFYYVQYSIAPVVLANDTEKDLVVGYFHDHSKAEDIAQRERLLLVKNLGNGFFLFRGKIIK